MRRSILVALILSIGIWGLAQHKKAAVNDASGKPIMYSAGVFGANAGLSITIDKHTKRIESFNRIPNQPLTNHVFLEGSKQIELFLSIPKDSIRDYRYNIVLNDSVWLHTDALIDSLHIEFAFQDRLLFRLGNFQVESSKLTVEFYKITQSNRVSSTTIYNKPVKPAALILTSLWVTNNKGVDAVEMENRKDGFEFKIHDKDRVRGILVAIQPSDLTFIYHVYIKNRSTGKSTLVSNSWNYGFINSDNGEYPYLIVDAIHFSNPGNYELSIIPQLSTYFRPVQVADKTTKISFTVLRSPTMFTQRQIILWAIIIVIVACLISTLLFYLNRLKSKKKVQQELEQKEIAQIQLQSVKSQLNPHFIFNALSGIQNLINQNQIDQANKYLTKFSRLTRSILNDTTSITLEEETALLDDYLQMEQLRFGFKYLIEVQESVEAKSVEIPAMLMQPLVENAVKHGVSELKQAGLIEVIFSASNNDLVITITDNGGSFNPTTKGQGFGLTLIEKRVALLNKLYGERIIELQVKSLPSQTKATVALKNWLPL